MVIVRIGNVNVNGNGNGNDSCYGNNINDVLMTKITTVRKQK